MTAKRSVFTRSAGIGGGGTVFVGGVSIDRMVVRTVAAEPALGGELDDERRSLNAVVDGSAGVDVAVPGESGIGKVGRDLGQAGLGAGGGKQADPQRDGVQQQGLLRVAPRAATPDPSSGGSTPSLPAPAQSSLGRCTRAAARCSSSSAFISASPACTSPAKGVTVTPSAS